MRDEHVFIISLILSYSPCSWEWLLSFLEIKFEKILGKRLEADIPLLISLPEYTDLPLKYFPYL
nr:MAG TPA: hypothetical protein [Caudoviricetes sp.]